MIQLHDQDAEGPILIRHAEGHGDPTLASPEHTQQRMEGLGPATDRACVARAGRALLALGSRAHARGGVLSMGVEIRVRPRCFVQAEGDGPKPQLAPNLLQDALEHGRGDRRLVQRLTHAVEQLQRLV